jgi:hypothetical protein
VESDIWMASNFELKLDLNLMLVRNIRRFITKRWMDYRRPIAPSPLTIGE